MFSRRSRLMFTSKTCNQKRIKNARLSPGVIFYKKYNFTSLESFSWLIQPENVVPITSELNYKKTPRKYRGVIFYKKYNFTSSGSFSWLKHTFQLSFCRSKYRWKQVFCYYLYHSRLLCSC